MPKDSSLFILMYRLLEGKYFLLFIIFMPILFFAPNYSYDCYLGHQMRFLFVQGLDFKKYRKTKFFLAISNVFQIIFFVLVVILIYGNSRDIGETLTYPILKYKGIFTDASGSNIKNYYEWLNLGSYLCRSAALLFADVFFSMALLQFINSIFKKRLKSTAIFLSIFIISYLISLKYGIVGKFSPFTYFRISDVVTGSLPLKYNIFDLDYLYGVFINLFLGTVLLLALIYRKREKTI